MIITIKTDSKPTSDLGFILHKHPDKFQSFDLTFGKVHVFYPKYSDDEIEIAITLDIDPIEIIKNSKKSQFKEFSLAQYVNDRPYVSSSLMGVALSKVFSTAMNGRCNGHEELVEKKLSLDVKIAVVSAPKGGERVIKAFFEPLGYQISIERHILDDSFSEWGGSKYYTVQLRNILTIKELLSHLYILLPALDNNKHYFIGSDEVDKILSKGEGWLANHPEKNLIIKRYLSDLNSLIKEAQERVKTDHSLEKDSIVSEESIDSIDIDSDKSDKISLNKKRYIAVLDEIRKFKPNSVIDFGCGEGKFLKLLLKERYISKIGGVDVSYSELIKAKERIFYDKLSPKEQNRVEFFQGSLLYKDERVKNYDVVTVVEVIEHIELEKLQLFELSLFKLIKPKVIIVTTPNKEYNVEYKSLLNNQLRHNDHRFEWSREQFESWVNSIAFQNGYIYKISNIGDVVDGVGSPTLMATFILDE